MRALVQLPYSAFQFLSYVCIPYKISKCYSFDWNKWGKILNILQQLNNDIIIQNNFLVSNYTFILQWYIKFIVCKYFRRLFIGNCSINYGIYVWKIISGIWTSVAASQGVGYILRLILNIHWKVFVFFILHISNEYQYSRISVKFLWQFEDN